MGALNAKLATLILLMLIAQPLVGIIVQGQENLVLEYKPTNIYNLYEVRIKNEGFNLMNNAIYIEGGLIALAGREYIALIDADRKSTIWSESIIGDAISIGADSSDPRWIAVGTDEGEIVTFRLDDSRERIDYYTGQAAEVIQTYVLKSGNNYRLLATVEAEDRYIYIYEPGNPYWSEIGLIAGDEPSSNISGLRVAWAAPLKVHTSYTSYYYDASRVLLVLESASRFMGTVTALIYYNSTDTLTLEPALPGVSQVGDLIEVRNLTYYLLYRGGIVSSGPVGGGEDVLGYQLEITGLYQTIVYDLVVVYEIKLIDNTSNIVVDSQCYYNKTRFMMSGKQLDLGNIILNVGGKSKTNCLSKAGISINNFINTNSVLSLNTLYGPSNIEDSNAFSFKILPTPDRTGFLLDEPLFDLVQPYIIPSGMDNEAKIIFAVSNSERKYVYIYVLDKDFNILSYLGSGDFVEQVSVKDDVSYITISPDGKRIYIGTDNGRILLLEWNPIQKRYIATNTMKISYSSITSIKEINNKYVIVSAEDGSMQLINLQAWTPLWRGAPGYSSLKIDADSFKIVYANENIVYAISKDKFIKFIYSNNEYQPVILNITTTISTLYGDTISFEGNITLYALDEQNNIILKSDIVQGEQVIIYLPRYPIDLYLELEGIGKVKIPQVISKFPNEIINVNIKLREIRMYIYTPDRIGDARKDPGYMLVSGPKSNARIVLASSETRVDNYIVLENVINGTSDSNGVYETVIFDSVRYSGTISKDHYHEKSIIVDEYGPLNISIDIHPILYRFNIKIIDEDALLNNVVYKLNGTVKIIRVDSSKSVTLNVLEDSIYYIPNGTYNITVSALHYKDMQYFINVYSPYILEARLQPETYTINIVPLAFDKILNINNLILNNSIIKIRLVEPYRGNSIMVNVGDQIALRYGLYEIEVIDWVTRYVNYVWINKSESVFVKGELYYSDVKFNVYDKEISDYIINNITLVLKYKYNNFVKQIVLKLDDISNTIMIPYGIYTMHISRIGYEDYMLAANISKDKHVINVFMNPAIVNIALNIQYRDSITGIAKGPVPSTSLKLVLIDPAVNITYSLYGNEQGLVAGIIREGTYSIVVESPYTKTARYTIKLTRIGEEQYTIYVEPRYALLNITVIDSEVPVKLAGVSITINRLGPGDTSSFTITSITGKEQILLPVGDYLVMAEIPSRYMPSSIDIRLMSDSAVTLRAEPIRVMVQVSALAEDAYIEYKGVRYPLPPGLIDNATIRIIPNDPLLLSLGIDSIEINTGLNGTTLVRELRAGTYLVVAVKEGYISKPVIVPVLTETRQIEAKLVPVQWSWVFSIVDIEVIEEYSYIESGIIKVDKYNNMPAGVSFEYRSGDIILMPTGMYNISASAPGYSALSVEINVGDSGNTTLPVKSHRAILNIQLKADIAGLEAPVMFGQIEALAVDVPLKNPIILFNVTDGKARIEVRPGTYKLTYIIQGVNTKWDLGLYNITSNYTETKTIDVDVAPLKISLFDIEYEVPIDEGKVEVKYLGPFGERIEAIEQYRVGVRDTVILPPGIIEIKAEVHGYENIVKRFFVGSDTQEVKIYMAPITIPIIISFTNPDGNEIKEPMIVIIKHTKLPATYENIIEKSTVYFDNVRLGEYELIIKPSRQNSIYNITKAQITVMLDGVDPPSITVNYKLFNTTIVMNDKELNTPIKVPYKISIDRKGEASQRLGFPKEVEIVGKTSVLLPPGEYMITIIPVELDVYTPPPQISFKIPQLSTVKIDMEPKRYPVSILVLDDRGKPLDGALVTIQAAEGTVVAAGYTDASGQYSVQLRFGLYTVSVERVGYLKSDVALQVPVETAKTVSLEPELLTKIRRMAPLIIGIGGLLVLLITLYVMRERLTRRILEEEEYF